MASNDEKWFDALEDFEKEEVEASSLTYDWWRSLLEPVDVLKAPVDTDLPEALLRTLMGVGALTPEGTVLVLGGELVDIMLRPDMSVSGWMNLINIGREHMQDPIARLFLCAHPAYPLQQQQQQGGEEEDRSGPMTSKILRALSPPLGGVHRSATGGSMLIMPSPIISASGCTLRWSAILSLERYEHPAEVADHVGTAVMLCDRDGVLQTMRRKQYDDE